MVKISELKGKRVIAKRGMHLGEIEDVELDNNNWTVTTAYVKLTPEIAKIFDAKGGFMKKSVAPIPGNLLGPIGDSIVLKEEIKEPEDILKHVQTARSLH